MKIIICFFLMINSILNADISKMNKNESNATVLTATEIYERYDSIANSPLIFLSLVSCVVHGVLFIILPIYIFAKNKQTTINLIKSKKLE
jgi:hypothetical protein